MKLSETAISVEVWPLGTLQYFQCTVPPNPGIYSVSNVRSPLKSGDFWYFQCTEYRDRMGAELLQGGFLPKESFVHPAVLGVFQS